VVYARISVIVFESFIEQMYIIIIIIIIITVYIEVLTQFKIFIFISQLYYIAHRIIFLWPIR
jgi:hypothetical protein